MRPALGAFVRYEALDAPGELPAVGTLLPPIECTREGDRERCSSCRGRGLFCGPVGVTWTFEGRGTRRRLVEVFDWEYPDG
jgi:hypothetical protein